MSDSPDPPFHARSPEQAMEDLGVRAEAGLSKNEVRKRRERHGPNRLREARRRSVLRIALVQFRSVVILILVAAGALAVATAKWPEAIALAAVIVVNAGIGFVSEWRAARSMEALRRLGRRRVRVRRGKQERSVPVTALVPGDVVIFDGGDIVPADLRLIEANNLHVNEAALTGEAMPVRKNTDRVEENTPLAERANTLFKGTTITEGSGEGVVTATGMNTELGRIAELAEGAESETTPLQKHLDRLGSRLAWLTLVIAAIVALAGLAAGQPMLLMIETAIALGVAAIPEGLPIVATIALARGMWLMARRQALVNRLTAVETLGATRIILTDKTGTLTENRMTVRRVLTPAAEHTIGDDTDGLDDDALARRLLKVGVLCNNASIPEDDGEEALEQGALGDPTEVALLEAGARLDLRRDDLLERLPEAKEHAFDPDMMMMATVHEDGEDHLVAVKGAPQAVLEKCTALAGDDADKRRELDDDERRRWETRAEDLAEDGYRVLAFADRRVDQPDTDPYADLRFLGLLGLHDPPREKIEETIAACRAAGVRVVMVTGDQPKTARAVGGSINLADRDGPDAVLGRDLRAPEELSEQERQRVLDASIFARVSPEQKLDLVSVYQAEGEVVAMTGDGVNDAPALKKADIGVAMGKRGTDAAREAADMVLKDDRLATIVAAIREGRIIFRNIRKSVMFMLCTNLAEIIAVAGASLVGAPLPLRPLQILYLNVLTDVFPALAFGVGKGDDRVMHRPPRPADEAVLTRRHWLSIGGWSVVISACVLAGLTIALQGLGLQREAAVTVSFLTLGFAKLWFVLNLRDADTSPWRNDVVGNPWMWLAIVGCAVLLLAAVYLPGLSDILRTRAPGVSGWSVILGLSVLPMLAGQGILVIRAAAARRADAGDSGQEPESQPRKQKGAS
ncbi:MAG: cation-transporting P-type ATPase [Planctomycetota bacterium]|nr:cation-transporting P-type ATPase [Planctomycetota bacterium]